MLVTTFKFQDQESATKHADDMIRAAKEAHGFGKDGGVKISPYIKPDGNEYSARMEVGPDTPEFNMFITVPMDECGATVADKDEK